MKKKAKKLAETLKNNWMLHDNKDYFAIKKNSKALLSLLGYEVSNIEKASAIIMNLFKLADEAQQYQYADRNREEKIYLALIEKADELDRILGRRRNSRYEIYWWRSIRHRRHLTSVINLFRDQLHKLGIKNFYHVLICTLLLIKTGKAHDKKDWKVVVVYLEKYFEIIKKTNVREFIEF